MPSRTDVAAYEDEREEVEELDRPGSTPNTAASNGSVPIIYMDTSLDEGEMAAWFALPDALVVTSLADGMNLVAKEFVASRGDLGGTLILSEFAGAAQDLDGALIVNPYDIEAIKRALVDSHRNACSERAARLKTMRAAVAAQRRAPMGAQLPRSAAVDRHAVRASDLALRTDVDRRATVPSTVRHLR